jgi:hypothetical protein
VGRRQLSWDDIEKRARKQHGVRARRPRRRLITLLVLVLAGSIGVVVAGFAGQGPYASLAERRTTTTPAAPGTTQPGGTTTTEFLLDGKDYRPGDCVVWDRNDPDARYHATDTVPCGQDHIIEIAGTGLAEGTSDRVPTDDEMHAAIERECTVVVEKHFGGKVDPYGRYFLSALTPSDDGWRRGGRTLWCGLQANWVDPDDQGLVEQDGSHPSGLFRGEARAATQSWAYEPGDCLGPGSRMTVPCTGEHDREVVGTMTLPGDTVLPADRDGWSELTREPCSTRAGAYLGRPPSAPWSQGWQSIEPESWAAGERTVTCFVGQWNGADDWLIITGSARGQNA